MNDENQATMRLMEEVIELEVGMTTECTPRLLTIQFNNGMTFSLCPEACVMLSMGIVAAREAINRDRQGEALLK